MTPLLAVVLAACAPQPEPRTVSDFMDDGFARDGVLTRCNQNRDETLDDAECNNARRAAATLALEAERGRAPELERQSEAQLAALRERETGSALEDTSALLGRRSLEIEVEPPSNDLVIAPALEVPELAVVPRPFSDESARQ